MPHSHPIIRKIGLTGGIGSGKSTVAKILNDQRGFALIDADAISRALTAPEGEAIEDIKSQFGPQFILVDQSLDRQKMRDLVFNDPNARKRLESIIHPKVLGQIERQIFRANDEGMKTVLIDIPLLAESHARWQQRLDAVLVVDCMPETQVQRVTQRSGLDPQSVLKIISSQATREARNALANWIIFNEGLTLEELESEVMGIDFEI